MIATIKPSRTRYMGITILDIQGDTISGYIEKFNALPGEDPKTFSNVRVEYTDKCFGGIIPFIEVSGTIFYFWPRIIDNLVFQKMEYKDSLLKLLNKY